MEKISKLIANNDADFILFSTDFCPYCSGAIKYLEQKSFTIAEINLQKNQEMLNLVKKETNHWTVPIILDVRNEKINFVGGFDDLRKYL